MPKVLAVVRAEALFASNLQSSESPAAEQVRTAIDNTLARFGPVGCATRVAGEFGDHPEVAVTRMRWALATVHALYPRRRMARRRPRTALAAAA